MAKQPPALTTTSRPIDPDEHALNAICLTQELFGSEIFQENEHDFCRIIGGEFGLRELIQKMARAVSDLECCYDRSPWNDQLDTDWESACSLFTEAVLSHIDETGEVPNLHIMLARVLFPSNEKPRHG